MTDSPSPAPTRDRGDRQPSPEPIVQHYSRNGDWAPRITALLREHGLDPHDPEAVARLDQLHLGGEDATQALADWAGISGTQLLDVGCGLGGPARMLAHARGCDVTGIDITPSYCRDAAVLSDQVGLGARTRFACASAHDIPFPSGSFPWVWTQHAAMNIPDKRAMYAEVTRVLQPGGRFVLHDIVAGPGREPYFPVPWASTPDASFLLPARGVHELLRQAGLRERAWEDLSQAAVQRIQRARARLRAGEPEGLGPHLLQGDDFQSMRRNLARNLEEGRVGVIRAVFEKAV
ncbi:class I SAM-dependent methyltransferase [Rhodovibrio salinarum]|nr:methyltransferase domain-containing protein [Rhodovibrio salinarum]